VSTLGGPWRLVVADMDGTLVTGTTACVHLDDWIGHGRVIDDLERRFASGEITNTQVAESYAPFYRNIALADATAVMAQIPSLDDIALGVSLLSRRGIEARRAASRRDPRCARIAAVPAGPAGADAWSGLNPHRRRRSAVGGSPVQSKPRPRVSRSRRIC